MILDEPTVGVDIDNIKTLHDTLANLKKNGITIILVSHDMDFCSDLTDYYLILNDLCEYTFKKAGDDNVPC